MLWNFSWTHQGICNLLWSTDCCWKWHTSLLSQNHEQVSRHESSKRALPCCSDHRGHTWRWQSEGIKAACITELPHAEYLPWRAAYNHSSSVHQWQLHACCHDPLSFGWQIAYLDSSRLADGKHFLEDLHSVAAASRRLCFFMLSNQYAPWRESPCNLADW